MFLSTNSTSTNLFSRISIPSVLVPFLIIVFSSYTCNTLQLSHRPWIMNEPVVARYPRQLVRHKAIITPCNVRALLPEHTASQLIRGISKQLELFADERHSSNSFDSNHTWDERLLDQLDDNSLLSCTNQETIAIVSFEDLTMAGLEVNETKTFNTPNDICLSRSKIVPSRKDVNVATTLPPQLVAVSSNIEPNEIWQPETVAASDAQFVLACNRLLESELAILNSTKSNCDRKKNCTILLPDQQQLVTESCIQLSQYDLIPIIQINYVCLPIESEFSTRNIRIVDISNTISCSQGKLLYVKKSLFNPQLSDDSSMINESKQYAQSPENLSRPRLGKFVEDYDYSDTEFDLASEAQSRSSRSSVKLSDNGIKPHGVPSKLGGAFHSKRKYTRDLDDHLKCEDSDTVKLIASHPIEMCHSQQRCSISLSRVIEHYRRSHQCHFRTENLNAFYATLDYTCLDSTKFGDSSMGKLTYELDTNSSHLKTNFTVLNQMDYGSGLVFITELGQLNLDRVDAKSSSGTNSFNSMFSWCLFAACILNSYLIVINSNALINQVLTI